MTIHERNRERVEPSTLTFYSQPSTTTVVGRYRSQIEKLPGDVASLTALTHALVVHEHMAPAYGVVLSDEDRSSVQHRSIEQLLDHIMSRDDRTLDHPRAAAKRVPGNCWHFVTLLVAMLRVHGTPARARCGFANYFNQSIFEDHWVCEYWHAEQQRWILVDAQIDEMQRVLFAIDFDPLDVPREHFLVAGQAWARCRAGTADPEAFGLSITKRFGSWYVASNLMRDAAALQGMEMLPDDTWAAMPGPDQPVGDELAALFDYLATVTQAPDTTVTERRQLSRDDRLRLPDPEFLEARHLRREGIHD